MMKCKVHIWIILFLLSACGGKETKTEKKETTPIVRSGGKIIMFTDKATMDYFKTSVVEKSNVDAELVAPGKIAATVVSSNAGASQNIVLFENSELASNYTQLIQHQINIRQIKNVSIRQKRIDLDRAIDLEKHGAATGKEVLAAQTALNIEKANLDNEKAALIEHEAKLKAGGFDAELLQTANAGMAYVVCDIPENQISKVELGDKCIIQFNAYPNEPFTGRIDNIADVVDNSTRMVKLRINVNNSRGKLKAGMFATISFGIKEGNNITIDKDGFVTVQGKNYVFVKTGRNVFERREIKIGQQIDKWVIVYDGIKQGDTIAVDGVIQLKGLSFGY